MYGTLGIQEITELCLSQRKPMLRVVNSTGKSKEIHVSDVKYTLHAWRVIAKFPSYKSFGRQFKLRLYPQYIHNLKWEPSVTVNTNFISATSFTPSNSAQSLHRVYHCIISFVPSNKIMLFSHIKDVLPITFLQVYTDTHSGYLIV